MKLAGLPESEVPAAVFKEIEKEVVAVEGVYTVKVKVEPPLDVDSVEAAIEGVGDAVGMPKSEV